MYFITTKRMFGDLLNPTLFLRLELFQWFILLYAVLGTPNKPPYPDHF